MSRRPAPLAVMVYTHPMDRRAPEDVAVDIFQQGFTCGQAVLVAFAERRGLSREAALRVACAFGGGIARTGGTCGAVSGALMAIGLELGRTTVEDDAARERTYEAARVFLEQFRRGHGSDVCRELLGVDIGTPEGRQAAMSAGLFTSRCPELVRSAARIVETILDAGRGS
jgi:C_GCAxxG_C_C family probable redox protein